jgi:WD40 repeat protein
LSRPTDGSSSSDTAGKGQEQVVSAGADGRWIVWDLATGQEVRQRTSSSGLACIAWQGDYIVTGDNDHLVSVYDAKTFELLRTLKGHEDLIRTIDINLQEGVVVSGGYDQKIIVSASNITPLLAARYDVKRVGDGGLIRVDMGFVYWRNVAKDRQSAYESCV